MTNSDNSAVKLLSQEGIPFPEQVPILRCDEPIVFPHMIAPVILREEQAKKMVDEALRSNRLLGLFPSQIDGDAAENGAEPGVENAATVEGTEKDLFRVGTLCLVLRMLKIPDGTVRLLVHGITRIEVTEAISHEPHLVARIRRIEEEEESKDVEVEALIKQTRESLQRAIQLANLPEDLGVAALNIDEAGKLADLVASNTSMKREDLLKVLETDDPRERLNLVYQLLTRELYVMEIGNSIQEKVRDRVDQHQRDYFLREQIKAMQDELGEADPHQREIMELRERLEKKQMPEHAQATAERELDRLAMLQPAAAEYSVIRTYLDWILDVPWFESTDDHIDLTAAAKILDEDHYGLEKVKERILEYLAVIRLKGGNLKGPILCLVGPPGVGKTSLGRSIARATGRKFNRFSLGGMRDEAEIRGHRRTYIGAMPGRIIKALKDCGTINPLVMLDEIDKLGSDFRGDPSSALLEVLDPEQNNSFTDHYMDMPVDLSHVMFITTANSLDTIPGPLRDRMEIIRLAGYTDEEKLEIAKRYLVPREVDNAGLKKSQIRFHQSGLRTIIGEYTAEAGVRSLQKQIAAVSRKVARRIAEAESIAERDGKKRKPKKMPPAVIKGDNLKEYLGASQSHSEVAERMGRPGVSIGLAWTPIGGTILFVEASAYPGKGNLRLTGQLGDVMKESATAALTYLRANRDWLGVEDKVFAEQDFHIHVPAGATPKDGPSAGVAIVSALASLVTGRLVRDYVAMTGEISLRGNVLPVGGIKEKCLAAHRAGIKEVILPERNDRDLEEVPDQVIKGIKLHFIDRVGDLLDLALQAGKKPAPAKTRPKRKSSKKAARRKTARK